MPAVLVLGVIAPVLRLMFNPVVGLTLYVPPVVPVSVIACDVVIVLQYGEPAYVIVALGAAVIVTNLVALTAAQPPDAPTVYVTVYVPAVLVLGVIAPVLASRLKPVVEV